MEIHRQKDAAAFCGVSVHQIREWEKENPGLHPKGQPYNLWMLHKLSGKGDLSEESLKKKVRFYHRKTELKFFLDLVRNSEHLEVLFDLVLLPLEADLGKLDVLNALYHKLQKMYRRASVNSLLTPEEYIRRGIEDEKNES